MHHLPVRHPLPASSSKQLARTPSLSPPHSRRNARLSAHRNIRLHPTLPQSKSPVPVRSIHRPPHAILIVAHVPVSHADRINIRIDEARIPSHRVRHAVDVIPPSRIEAHKVPPQRRTNLHQLKRRLNLFHKHVSLNRANRQSQMLLQSRKHIVPKRRLFRRLNLRQVKNDGRSRVAQTFLVVHHV